jgi:hypothetical protein
MDGDPAVRLAPAIVVLCSAAPLLASVHATVADTPVRLDHGIAIVDAQHLHLYLSDAPVTCPRPPIPGAVTALHLVIPPGPGGRYFAGTAIAAEISVEGPRGLVEDTAIVRVAAVGRRVRGALDGDAARGRFDVVVCGGPAARDTTLAEAAPAGPVRGAVLGEPFVARSGLAVVAARPHPTLLSLRLYSHEDAECGRSGAGRALVVVPMPALFLEGPQPMESFVEDHGVLGEAQGRGWLSVAALRATHGATIAGQLVTPGAGGRFRATVCLAP